MPAIDAALETLRARRLAWATMPLLEVELVRQLPRLTAVSRRVGRRLPGGGGARARRPALSVDRHFAVLPARLLQSSPDPASR